MGKKKTLDHYGHTRSDTEPAKLRFYWYFVYTYVYSYSRENILSTGIMDRPTLAAVRDGMAAGGRTLHVLLDPSAVHQVKGKGTPMNGIVKEVWYSYLYVRQWFSHFRREWCKVPGTVQRYGWLLEQGLRRQRWYPGYIHRRPGFDHLADRPPTLKLCIMFRPKEVLTRSKRPVSDIILRMTLEHLCLPTARRVTLEIAIATPTRNI